MKPRLFYEKQARDLIKQAREDKRLTYKQLAVLLRPHGVTMETRALINRINRGHFTFEFALQVLAALDVVTLKLPSVLIASRATLPRTGVWISPEDPLSPKLPPKSSE